MLVFVSVKTVKGRWKNLRAYFFKECGKLDKPKSGDSADKICKSTWQYYDQLLFLKSMKNQSESSGRDSNISTDNNNYYSTTTDTILEELQNPGSVQTNSISDTSDILESQSYGQTSQRKKIRMNRTENNDQLIEIEKKKLEILERESIKEKNDDLLFFESLLPYMENIPLRRKLRLRSKIQELILAEIEAVENNVQQFVPVMHTPAPNINTQQSVEYELHVQNSPEQNLINSIPVQIENASALISYINNDK